MASFKPSSAIFFNISLFECPSSPDENFKISIVKIKSISNEEDSKYFGF